MVFDDGIIMVFHPWETRDQPVGNLYNAWATYGQLMGYPRASHVQPKGNPWATRGTRGQPVDNPPNPWTTRGQAVANLWSTRGQPMGNPRATRGQPVINPWLMSGQPTGNPQIAYENASNVGRRVCP